MVPVLTQNPVTPFSNTFGPACFPGSLLSFLSSATEFSFYLEVICQLHLFPGYFQEAKAQKG